jgi:arylsulfatase A-like enzyme
VLLSTGRNGTNHPELLLDHESLAQAYQRGEAASPDPGYGSYRPDALTAEIALAYLRVRRPRFLFLSLGDTDEHAHHGSYARYLEALRYADHVVGEIAVTLADMSAAGQPTLLVVTADHGRASSFAEHGAAWPESSRVWLVAAGDAVLARGLVHSPTPRRLADIAPTVRAIAGLDRGPSTGTVMTELFSLPRLASR